MTWYAWALVALLSAGSVATVLNVEKPRKPMAADTAVLALAINGLMVWAIVALAERCS